MPDCIGHYTVTAALSTGGMATIYAGTHAEMGRAVVIKQLHPHLALDQSFVKRFEREARILGGLHHQNIVDIIDYFSLEGSYYIVLEYIDGRSLKELLDAQQRLPALVALSLAAQIARGLDYAHGSGIVHRDIKPANVMLAATGVAKITDFGLAYAKEALQVTDPGTFVGTPAYLAPEQLRGKKGDESSDLYALGVMLYEMLAGGNPFCGETHSQTIDRTLRLVPQRLSKLDPSLPRGVDDIVFKLLSKDENRRYRTAGQLLQDLQPYPQIDHLALAAFLASPAEFQPDDAARLAMGRLARQQRRARQWRQALTATTGSAAAISLIAAAITLAPRLFPPQPGPPPADTARPRPAPDTAAVVPPATRQGIRVSGTTGASIALDGSAAGSIPFAVPNLRPGRHSVRVELDGYLPQERTIDLKPGADQELVFNLAAVVLQPGYLKLSVAPWAEVYIDGTFIDRTPLAAPLQLDAGTHQMVLRHPNRKTLQRSVAIAAGDTLQLTLTMPEAFGFLKLTAAAGTRLSIDGLDRGVAPLASPLKLSLGDHELRAVTTAGRETKETVTIVEDQTIERSIAQP